jgi:hypothetical protein
MKRFILVFIAFLAAPVQAQVNLPAFKQIQTQYGPVGVLNLSGLEQVYFAGQPLTGLSDESVFLYGPYGQTGDGVQTVLVSFSNMGNGCFDDFALIRVGEGRIVPTERFGGCTRQVLAMRSFAGGVEIDLPAGNPRLAYQRFRFDAAGLSRTDVARDDAQVKTAGAGADVTRWIGARPLDPFQDASERNRFLTIMTAAQMDDFTPMISVANAVVLLGDFVAGRGCLPHSCNTDQAAWAIRISDGRPFAVSRSNGVPGQVFGSAFADLPPALQQFLATGRF